MSDGTMTQQWTVWCGNCEVWEQTSGSKSSCSQEFRKMGWKKAKGQWMCPKCAKKSPVLFSNEKPLFEIVSVGPSLDPKAIGYVPQKPEPPPFVL